MTTVLRFMLDDLLNDSTTPAVQRYGLALAEALVTYAPTDCEVEGITARRSQSTLAFLHAQIPSLETITSLDMTPATLRQAIVKGRAGKLVPPGLIHAPTLLAPLYPRRRTGAFHQTIVTWHSSVPTFAFTPTGKPNRLTKSLIERLERFADAVIVSSQTEAELLETYASLGDRIRIIPGAPTLIDESASKSAAKALGLPTRYFCVYAPDDEAAAAVYRAMASVKKPIDVVMLTPGGDPQRLTKTQQDRIHHIDVLDVHALTTTIAQATAVFYLAPEDRKLFTLSDVMARNVPLVYLGSQELIEQSGGVGYRIDAQHLTGAAIAKAMDALAHTRKLPKQLKVAGDDYVEHFSWQRTAEQIWQLHADL